MKTARYKLQRIGCQGFSLLEMIVSMVIMSIIVAVVMPTIVTSTDVYTISRDTRSDTDRVLYALEHSARFVREMPFMADESGLSIQTASTTQLLLTDGSGIQLNGSELEILKPGGIPSVLCVDVDRIKLSYYNSAGVAMAILVPSQIHRVSLQIQSGPVTLEMYAMPRSWIGRGGA